MKREREAIRLSQNEIVKSSMLFVLHFVILLILVACVLFGDKLGSIGEMLKVNGANYLYMVFCLILLFVISYFYFLTENAKVLKSGKTITLIFCALYIYIVIAMVIGTKIHVYARPVAMVALLIYALVGRRDAIFVNILCALIMFVVDNFSTAEHVANNIYSSLFISFSAGMVAIFYFDNAKTRFQVIKIGLVTVLPIDAIIFLLEFSSIFNGATTSLLEFSEWSVIFDSMGYGVFGGVGSVVLYLAVLPVFEAIFNCLTAFRIRELTANDAKLLKKLQEEANGTYNHSHSVAQLAEACAAALGEDVDYARAAALYHDVGKLHQPEYFTENQWGYNVHDELTPELSADIVRSHAQDGYDLILSHRLPQFLADVAVQHHGTLPIRYFYAKAMKLTDGELNIEEFSYLGPKPQTKIAAIIMIADAAEASVRALKDRTPEAVERTVREIIEERMDLEQFSECDITMADLTKIRMTIVNVLTGVYHHRVKYPKIKYKNMDGKTVGEQE
ncbi:MAG: HDIG domain-containing protein [Clostridia bacterium]|nr:HDIG domain-containing protein [Clostridia bacterium]